MIAIFDQIFNECVSGSVSVQAEHPENYIDDRSDSKEGKKEGKAGKKFVVVQIDG